jgi:amino acid transporter
MNSALYERQENRLMDNKTWSQIKRGLKVTGDYLTALLVFGIFSSISLSIFKDNLEKGIFIFSIVIFLFLLSMLYSGMSDVAFREKRPQYNINPPPYKGFLYGIVGTIPLFIIQLLYYIISVPEDLLLIKRRVLQAFTGPLYWLASLISQEVWAYHLVLLIIPIITGLGYLAGHHEFYISKKIKLFDKLRQKQQEKLEQQRQQRQRRTKTK